MSANMNPNTAGQERIIDDVSYVRQIQHRVNAPWHRYDILLEARPYGWETAVDWADYLSGADIGNLGTLTVFDPGRGEAEMIDAYHKSGDSISAMPGLKEERSGLAIGGFSRVLGSLVKFVWFNQTRTITIYTAFNDEDRVLRYAETAIRRTFGTDDAMLLAKPVPKEN